MPQESAESLKLRADWEHDTDLTEMATLEELEASWNKASGQPLPQRTATVAQGTHSYIMRDMKDRQTFGFDQPTHNRRSTDIEYRPTWVFMAWFVGLVMGVCGTVLVML